MMRSQPRTRTSTRFTPSGRRISAGNRMAWLRLLVKTVVVVMVEPFCLNMAEGNRNRRREAIWRNAGRCSMEWVGVGFGADE